MKPKAVRQAEQTAAATQPPAPAASADSPPTSDAPPIETASQAPPAQKPEEKAVERTDRPAAAGQAADDSATAAASLPADQPRPPVAATAESPASSEADAAAEVEPAVAPPSEPAAPAATDVDADEPVQAPASGQVAADSADAAATAQPAAAQGHLPEPEPAAVEPLLESIDELTDEQLQERIDKELQGIAIDEVLEQPAALQPAEELPDGSRHKATVVKVHRDDVFFSLGGRLEGVASLRQFKKPPKPGAMMEVVVRQFNTEEGLYELTIPGAAIDVADWSDLTEGTVVEARITGCNTGGLECMVNTIRGFIPASQIDLYHVENMAQFIGQKMPCVVMEVNRRRRKLVLSHRAVLERQREEERQALLERLEPGQVCEGTVSSLRDFGAFVDLGGVDGLIHISKLSWDHVDHPKEVLSEGQRVRVKIEKVNRQTGKVALTYRDLLEHPWEKVEQKYPEGSVVEGTVSRIATFGAFVKLEPGVEGMIHISELAHHRVASVGSVLKEGQQVRAKVLSVDRQAQRIALSLKATQAEPEPEERAKGEGAEAPVRPLAVPPRKAPLKGGKDTSSGGEKFGLKW